MTEFHTQWPPAIEPAKPKWLDNWCELNGVDPTWNGIIGSWMLVLTLLLPPNAPLIYDVSPKATLEEFLALLRS